MRGYGAGRAGGRTRRTGVEFEVSDKQRRQLAAIAADGNSKRKHARQARVVLLSDDGLETTEIMAATGASKPTVWYWQARFMNRDHPWTPIDRGVEDLLRDKTHKPGKPPVSEEKVSELMEKAVRPPLGGETRWTVRALAAEVGVAASTAHRNLAAGHKTAPHRMRQFKVSTDPNFARRPDHVSKVLQKGLNEDWSWQVRLFINQPSQM